MSQRDRYMAKEIGHDQYYGMLVELYGENFLRTVLPATREEIEAAFAKDKYLNTIPLERWDRASERLLGTARDAEWRQRHIDIAGTAGTSLSDRVCILKCAARRLIDKGNTIL